MIMESLVSATFNVLEPIRFLNSAICFCNAGSSEYFGSTGMQAALEYNFSTPIVLMRPTRFVTSKIVSCATCIAEGQDTGLLTLGNLDMYRNWGSASEYVDLIWHKLKTDTPPDNFIAAGHSWTLRHEAALVRPSDITHLAGDPLRAEKDFGWKVEVLMPEVVQRMAEAERKQGG